MVRKATDAEVMEYLWPKEQPAQRGRTLNNPKIASAGIAAALLLFSALLFGERAEASYRTGSTMLELCKAMVLSHD